MLAAPTFQPRRHGDGRLPRHRPSSTGRASATGKDHLLEAAYAGFLGAILAAVRLDRITLGGICSYGAARGLMEHRLGRSNAISDAFNPNGPSPDGRLRYPTHLRTALYRHMIGIIRSRTPNLNVSLCLEETSVFQALGLAEAIGRCNCVL